MASEDILSASRRFASLSHIKSQKSQIARNSQIAEKIAVAAQSQTLFERIRNRSAIANDFEARNRSANAICFYKKFTSLCICISWGQQLHCPLGSSGQCAVCSVQFNLHCTALPTDFSGQFVWAVQLWAVLGSSWAVLDLFLKGLKKGMSVIIWFRSLEKSIFCQIGLFYHENFSMAAKKRKKSVEKQ